MAQAWQTLEEAALTLGISLRTLHRRLARNELQTRLENGRREVLVVVSEFEPTADERAAAAEAVRGLTAASANAGDIGDAIERAEDDVQQTMLALHEDRIRRTDLAIMAYQQSVMVA